MLLAMLQGWEDLMGWGWGSCNSNITWGLLERTNQGVSLQARYFLPQLWPHPSLDQNHDILLTGYQKLFGQWLFNIYVNSFHQLEDLRLFDFWILEDRTYDPQAWNIYYISKIKINDPSSRLFIIIGHEKSYTYINML